ncbi:MAG: hypothetical protein KIT31_33195 [Deltaproteobacteria bacterium]|nr:hypothetical protein [Deltaproteobacteria bacterium]
MRWSRALVLAVAIAGCGGGGGGGKPAGGTAPKASAAPLTLDQMVRGFPDETTIVASLDIARLKQAPAIQKLWSIVTGTPALYAAIGTQSCVGSFAGVALDADQVLIGGDLPANIFTWMRGAGRDEYEACRARPENKRLLLQTQTTEVFTGDFATVTQPDKINQYLWLERELLVGAMSRKTPVTEDDLRAVARRARTPGPTLANPALRDLYERVDRSAALWAVMESPRFGAGLHGVAISVAFGDAIVAKLRLLAQEPGRVPTLVARFQDLGNMGKLMGLVERVETRTEGLEVHATVTAGPAQLDQLVELARAQLAQFSGFAP